MRRIVLIALLLSLAPATTARAQGRLCSPQASAEAAQQRLVAARREYGFNADPAYIGTLTQTYESDFGPIPVSAAEARYLRARDRLDPGAAGRRYLSSLGDVYAGFGLEDAWPRPAYLLVHFTRDARGHLAALKRVARFPQRLRADRVAHTTRALRRVQNRIDRDYRALARAGFTLEGTGVDDDSNRVEVELVTTRDDAAAYFGKRYGPVKTVVIAREPTKLECNTARSMTIAPDGMSLTVGWGTGGGARTERIEVTELPDRVEIGIVERVPVGARTLELIGADGVAPLSQPLGGRAVIDAESGKRIIQRGPSPGEPPCPAPAAERDDLERVMEERAGYGMRADAPYVQSLLADDREFTEHERRWVKSVQRLDQDNRVHEYTIHYREEWGGTAVVADYPAKPHLLVRLTKRLAFHTRALKRLARRPEDIRTAAAVHAVDEFYATADRINADASAGDGFIDGYGRAGFRVLDANGHQTANVEVRVVTARPDAAAYFAQRYGDYVEVEVVGDRFECV